MELKIYISGNYLFVEDEQGRKYSGAAGDVVISPVFSRRADLHFFNIKNLPGWDPAINVEINQIKDSLGAAFSLDAFNTFYQKETGKANAGGAASKTLTQEEYDALTVEEQNDGTIYFIY